MVALVAAFGVFHLTQQPVHFFQGELAVGPYCAVAGHGGEQLVFGPVLDCAGIVLG